MLNFNEFALNRFLKSEGCLHKCVKFLIEKINPHNLKQYKTTTYTKKTIYFVQSIQTTRNR